jgi:hypothetical protein
MPRWWLVLALAMLALAVPRGVRAADGTAGPPPPPPSATGTRMAAKPPVVIWPTLTPAGDASSSTPMHRPPFAEKALFERAQELDATLRDAVQDLGFTLFVADAGPAPGRTRDEDLLERASRTAAGGAPGDAGTWVVSPRIEAAGGGAYTVRMVAAPPRGRELRVRVETVPGDSVGVRGLVMLRDLLTPEAAAEAASEQERRDAGKGTTAGVTAPTRSQGRAVLAIGAGLFGAFTSFSLDSAASGQSDPRVLYPLLAVGTGVGIGAALLVADEWDVTSGDAWYLTAGAGWGSAAGVLIAAGQNVQPSTDRYSWGVGGGFIGLGLASFALTRTSMDEGDATLVHSGAALGLLAGGTIDWIGKGTTAETPYGGMGFGAGAGLLGAGLLAAVTTTSPSRVMLIDLGAGGGALAGAAAGSPLIFQNQTPGNVRGWLGITLGGSVVGGGIAWWLTRDTSKKAAWLPAGRPLAGVIGTSATRKGEEPIVGVGWSGGF